jgi:hypothetical protein
MSNPGDVKLTVTVDQEDIVVNQSIHAGVDGPIFTEPVPGDLARVDEILKAEGFERVSEWQTGRAYNGLYLKADLIQR